MDQLRKRHRSLTAASAADTPIAEEIHALVQNLNDTLPLSSERHGSTIDTLQVQCNDLRRIRQILIEQGDHGRARDAFRHVGGFICLLDTLRSVSGFYDASKLSRDERTEFFELLKATFEVLSEALVDHAGNKRYFAKRVEGGGWRSLEQALASTGIINASQDGLMHVPGLEQLFGCLLAFALGEEAMSRVFRDIEAHLSRISTTIHKPIDDGSMKDTHSVADLTSHMVPFLEKFFSGNEVVRNPEALLLAFNFWTILVKSPLDRSLRCLSVGFLHSLQIITTQSTRNAVAVHGTGVLGPILRLLLDDEALEEEIQVLPLLADSMMQMGVTKLDDAYFLFRRASISSEAANFTLRAIRVSRGPAFIQFDLSPSGYASVEFSRLGRSFPPPASSAGYSFCAWIYIDKFDSSTHTTIFGAYDAGQICFLLAYIEKDSRQFILQTSLTQASSRSSVRFKSTTFEPGRWYHLAIVHRRHKATTPSRATLYVDGHFTEEVRCHYPSRPAARTISTESFGSLSGSSRQEEHVQAFLGTPQALASIVGSNVVNTRWSLASFHLFEDALSDELIAVYQKMGPRYFGNFQDTLGSFQTYRASAELGLLNDALHPSKDEKSEIASAIKQKAANVLPESKVMLSISPLTVLDSEDHNHIDESELIKSLSRDAAHNLRSYTLLEGHSIAVNAANPSINNSLCHPDSIGVLTGHPVVCIPHGIDDAAWSIGGCTGIALKLIHLAKSPEAIVTAVKILFALVEDHWRNSEAMEREAGYAVLSGLIQDKLGIRNMISQGVPRADTGRVDTEEMESLAADILDEILRFVGYDHESPQESIITNPLAYRTLLVEPDTWRRVPLKIQRTYYEQFIQFAENSKHHRFNNKRLVRMRIIKRLIEALKGERFSEAFPDFLRAFKTLIKCNMSPEILRNLSLFITFALHDERFSLNRSRRQGARAPNALQSVTPDPATPRSVSPQDDSDIDISREEIGVRILQLYTELTCDPGSIVMLKQFSRSITSKWLFSLLAERDPRAVLCSTRIFARLLVTSGTSYVKSFADHSGGFVIFKRRLRAWWNMPAMWTVCFAILFGCDIAKIDFDEDFNLASLTSIFPVESNNIMFPQMLPVLFSMLEAGLLSLSFDEESTLAQKDQDPVTSGKSTETSHLHPRSMSLGKDSHGLSPKDSRIPGHAEVLRTVIEFLTELHLKSQSFRNFAISSDYVSQLLFALYPVAVSSERVSAETELHSRGQVLSFDGQDINVQPRVDSEESHIMRTTLVDSPPSPATQKVIPLRRGSTFILLTPRNAPDHPAVARLNAIVRPTERESRSFRIGNALVEELLNVVIAVFLDQILFRREFPGFGLFLKVPPGFVEHQACFLSYILIQTMSTVSNNLRLNQKLAMEPRVLMNLARYASHMCEALFEGWFLGGANPLLDFLGGLLEILQRPDVAESKNVRLCSSAVTTLRSIFLRVVLLQLSELNQAKKVESTAFLSKLTYWQTVILSPENLEDHYLRLMSFLLYTKLIDKEEGIRRAAADFWRMILVQKPVETAQMFNNATSPEHRDLANGFRKIIELDNDAFLSWTESHRNDLNQLFFTSMQKKWEEHVAIENLRSEETAKSRIQRRRERLKQWNAEEILSDKIWRRHEAESGLWRLNVHSAERARHQRALQDQQDNFVENGAAFERMGKMMRDPGQLFETSQPKKWQLDETEARDRVRLKIIPETIPRDDEYQPKRRTTGNMESKKLSIDTQVKQSTKDMIGVTPVMVHQIDDLPGPSDPDLPAARDGDGDDEFEMIDDPNEDEDAAEDKNRKVLRSLTPGDSIQHVCNVSRIVGLEAREGLLIIGSTTLYLLDNYFHRSDGEVVSVGQAPQEERDPYLQIILGQEKKRTRSNVVDQTKRHWSWPSVISVSKRRFIFRDVAIEIFFGDGRSYLLTTLTPHIRNDLYSRLVSKAPQVNTPISPSITEDAWRLEALRNPDEAPQSIGAKFANVFNSVSSNPATRKWVKGEMSNFAYLMWINTLAGRTFNDLTQYPVFPWVLADYTSEELDLTNPKTFRDLSKPMGCQTATREAEFRERYQSFAEMGDHTAQPFHYGTHYSSAMIVTSYLIRLQPFVASYLLLQGGTFDHADRIFHSIERAWMSASRDNMTDVRELTPEFFYLPDFLANVNKYNFGLKQNEKERIGDVVLPPWAKGSPNIFIARHREALESPYVSQHLHLWIDLVFGYKQLGEAAMEATNVFHHLSYRGAADLDAIEDPVVRVATTGIIHNFGQTPHQVFQRPHVEREEDKPRYKRLDSSAESLVRLPQPLLDSREAITSLLYSSKVDRLLCAGAFRLNIPPMYDRYMEWGFADDSVRFYSSDNRRLLSLFEHVHQGQVACALFVDGKTLVTAGTDCVLIIHSVISQSRTVDLRALSSLYGHRNSITALAASKTFGALVSCDSSGKVYLWDLNRFEFIREINHRGQPVHCARINNVSGDIVLCSGSHLLLYTLNGKLLLDQDLCDTEEIDDVVSTCAFYEGVGNEWLVRELMFTGHKRGVVKVWQKAIDTYGKWGLELVKRLEHAEFTHGAILNQTPRITCILPIHQVVYTGDENGRVYEWDCMKQS
ncbi:beach-domain-containing protein [Eremomyces bilateralis CBS 781.70]|uniref:Beach-domain-containing protein n=1 Tax=Eremomyces bilateralis CBS 781.70 TaxID=1392243 RepID=A0A6G1GFG8_9PEZI|nr:beach-domain-containing protein [Eremomyces bilateralis CBS 781.70]KAF1816742.1 beach-domain-containing protein [Eremomyces bilateralis CBS 781.70]